MDTYDGGRVCLVVGGIQTARELEHRLPSNIHVHRYGSPLLGHGPFDTIICNWYEVYAATEGAQYVEELKLKLSPNGKLVYI